MLLIIPFKTIKSIYSRPLYTYITSVDTGEEKQRVSVRETNRFTLYKETVSVIIQTIEDTCDVRTKWKCLVLNLSLRI
jgi:hypothetical protein